jgi:hypothetical protein
MKLDPPDEPLPEPLESAARTVAGDLNLDPHWLNTGPASQWKTGLPPGLEGRVSWQSFGGLSVGLVGRRDLVFFKLYAAAAWVQKQDPSPEFNQIVAKVIEHARNQRARNR